MGSRGRVRGRTVESEAIPIAGPASGFGRPFFLFFWVVLPADSTPVFRAVRGIGWVLRCCCWAGSSPPAQEPEMLFPRRRSGECTPYYRRSVPEVPWGKYRI